MENRTRNGKRKSAGQDLIFEISDADMSPDHADSDSNEPDIKIAKKADNTNIKDNLQIGKEISLALDSFIENKRKEHEIDISREKPEAGVKLDDTEDKLELAEDESQEGDDRLEEGEVEEVDTTLNKPSDNSPCIEIHFRDSEIADLYKFKFIKFIEGFVELETVCSDDISIHIKRDDFLNPKEWVVLDNTVATDIIEEKLTSPETSPQKKRKKKSKKQKELFILDTTPSQNPDSKQSLKYASKFQIDVEAEEQVEKNSVSANVCFNCDGNHSMRDCTLPRNHGKINAARNKFQSKKQPTRYHLEEDQKYSHLVPGKLSDKLREALGLHKNSIPRHVYLMRYYGYPPGWLEEAKVYYSNLAMFGADGQTPIQGQGKKKHGLDPEKIVDYPGFNVPMEKGMKDEHRLYHVAPYSEKFSKQLMIEFYEKKFLSEQDDFTTCDMDQSDDEMENSKYNITRSSVPHLDAIKKSDDVNVSSPSLGDLEEKKETLLAALEDNTSTISESKSLENTADDITNNTTGQLEAAPSPTENLDETQPGAEFPEKVNSVKDSTFGTPILKSSSEFAHLPNPDNFMKDVSPVINFENLPNSTGKYEQMTGLLQKVRSTLKNIQGCKS